MGIEIERRFLVDGRNEKPWRLQSKASRSLFQCYLSGVENKDGKILWNGIELVQDERDFSGIKTWRLRAEEQKVWLTAKGRKHGATGVEYEWQMPFSLFESLQGIENLPYTRKVRWLWHGEDNLLWEIDEFSDHLSGLVIAEVELESEEQPVTIPEWAGMELTNISGWSNASLARMVKDSKPN